MKKTAAVLASALILAPSIVPADELDARGRSLLNELGCKACHRFDGQGGEIGPTLYKVGKRLSDEQIRRQLVAPREVNPGSSMPAYDHLDNETIDVLVEFLVRQK